MSHCPRERARQSPHISLGKKTQDCHVESHNTPGRAKGMQSPTSCTAAQRARYLLRQRGGGAALGVRQLLLQPRVLALQVTHLQPCRHSAATTHAFKDMRPHASAQGGCGGFSRSHTSESYRWHTCSDSLQGAGSGWPWTLGLGHIFTCHPVMLGVKSAHVSLCSNLSLQAVDRVMHWTASTQRDQTQY